MPFATSYADNTGTRHTRDVGIALVSCPKTEWAYERLCGRQRVASSKLRLWIARRRGAVKRFCALGKILVPPKRAQVGMVEALTLLRWVGKIESVAWNDVVDVPPIEAPVIPRHTGMPKRFDMGTKLCKRAANQGEGGRAFERLRLAKGNVDPAAKIQPDAVIRVCRKEFRTLASCVLALLRSPSQIVAHCGPMHAGIRTALFSVSCVGLTR